MAKRGMLSDEIQKVAKEKLGREITTTELRLIPYAHYCALNNVDIGYDHKISDAEKAILRQWEDEGHITLYPSYILPRAMYDFMNDILWMSYVNFDDRAAVHATIAGPEA